MELIALCSPKPDQLVGREYLSDVSYCGDDGNALSKYKCDQTQWDAEGWPSASFLQLCLNVFSLLFLATLARRTGPSGLGVLNDAAAVIAVIGVKNRHSHYLFLQKHLSCSMFDEGVGLYFVGAATAPLAFGVVNYAWSTIKSPSSIMVDSTILRDVRLQPRIFPCRATHTRLFPKSHSFSYSYLYAGVPVGWVGAMNTLLSTHTSNLTSQDVNGNFHKTWFSVNGGDYLERTSLKLTLLQKLHGIMDIWILKASCINNIPMSIW